MPDYSSPDSVDLLDDMCCPDCGGPAGRTQEDACCEPCALRRLRVRDAWIDKSGQVVIDWPAKARSDPVARKKVSQPQTIDDLLVLASGLSLPDGALDSEITAAVKESNCSCGKAVGSPK